MLKSLASLIADLGKNYPNLDRVRVQLDYPRADSPLMLAAIEAPGITVQGIATVGLSDSAGIADPACLRFEYQEDYGWCFDTLVCHDCGAHFHISGLELPMRIRTNTPVSTDCSTCDDCTGRAIVAADIQQDERLECDDWVEHKRFARVEDCDVFDESHGDHDPNYDY